jgi:hypothetical protein
LRANRNPPNSPLRIFNKDDPRLPFLLEKEALRIRGEKYFMILS